MSESVPNAVNTGAASTIEPGPTPATPPVADTSVPAAFSSEATASPAAAPVTETPATTEAPAGDTPAGDQGATEAAATETTEAKPTSILSEVGTKEGEKKAEEKPAEAAAEAKPTETPALPTYEAFKVPDGVQLDPERLTGFQGILGEFEQQIAADPAKAHEAAQAMGQKLIDLYVTEARDAADRYTREQAANWTRTKEAWIGEFKADKEIGGNRQETSLKRMGALMDLYGQQTSGERLTALRDGLTMTGMGDHPEMLRFAHWVANQVTERARPVTPTMPRVQVAGTSRSDRLYKNSTPGAR